MEFDGDRELVLSLLASYPVGLTARLGGKTILLRSGEAIEGYVQFQVSRLRLPTTTKQFSQETENR